MPATTTTHLAPAWSCRRCGDGYYGTPPDDGLCPDCTATRPAA